MIGQPLFSIPLCPQHFERLQPTLILSILVCCLGISSAVCLSFLLRVPCLVGSSLQVLLILLCAYIISICFSHSGDKMFIRPNSMPDTDPHYFIRIMIIVGDAQKSSKASHFYRMYLSLYLCCKDPCFTRAQEV